MAIIKRKKGEQEPREVGGKSVAGINKLEEEAFAYTSWERRQHALTVSFIEGRQWVRPSDTGELVELNMDRYENEGFRKVTDNQIGKEIRRQAARLLTPLAWEVPAQGPDAASRWASHIAETVTRHTAHEHRWEELDRELWFAGRTGGCSALYVLWDAKAKGIGVDDAGEEFGEGDIVCGVADIGEFAVQPGRHQPAQAHWWILRRALPPQEVKELFELEDLPAADASEFGAIANRPGGSAHQQLTKVVTLFERPHGKHKGGVWTVVGGQIVEHTPWPFPFTEELNLEVYRPEQRARRWTGYSNAWDALTDQALINTYESFKIAYTGDALNAPWVVDGAFAHEMPQLPGEVIQVTPDPNGGFKPERVGPPQISEPLWASAKDARDRLVDKLGSSDVLAGDTPSGVTAGAAIAALIEQANTATSQMVVERARVWGRYASKVLKIYEDKVRSPAPRRQAMIHGSTGQPLVPLEVVKGHGAEQKVVKGWRGEDLMGHTEAVVPVGRILPRNRAASQALADSLLASGMISSPREYAAVADIPPDEGWLQVINADWHRAERENWQLAVGRPCVVEPIDDDAVHNESHAQFAKSSRFELLSDEAKALFREHMQQHETQAAEKAGRLQAQMATSPALAAAPQTANVHEGVVEALQSQPQQAREVLPGAPGAQAAGTVVPPPEPPGPSMSGEMF